MTCRCEHLGDEEPLRGAILHEDLVDRARRRTLSPFLDRRVLVQRGFDEIRRRRPADGDLAASLPRAHAHRRARTDVQRVGRAIEHRRALADPLPPFLPRDNRGRAAEPDEARLALAGVPRQWLAAQKTHDLEADVLPPRALGGQVEDAMLVVGRSSARDAQVGRAAQRGLAHRYQRWRFFSATARSCDSRPRLSSLTSAVATSHHAPPASTPAWRSTRT